jgi:hypothetical protein
MQVIHEAIQQFGRGIEFEQIDCRIKRAPRCPDTLGQRGFECIELRGGVGCIGGFLHRRARCAQQGRDFAEIRFQRVDRRRCAVDAQPVHQLMQRVKARGYAHELAVQ